MEHVRKWNIVIDLDEQENLIWARAKLFTNDTELVGVGTAQCPTRLHDVPEIGDELATSRALSDLAHKLFEATVADLDDVLHRTAASAP